MWPKVFSELSCCCREEMSLVRIVRMTKTEASFLLGEELDIPVAG